MCDYEDDDTEEQERLNLVEALIELTNEIHALRYDVCKIIKNLNRSEIQE